MLPLIRMSPTSAFIRLAFILIGMLSAVAPSLLVAEAEFDYSEAIARLNPMDLTGIDPELAKILGKYYKRSLGGSAHWASIESIRFEGTLRLKEDEFRFVAYKKKPDYCKIVLMGKRDGRLVMAYDGTDAWQLSSADLNGAVAMPPAEARNFIRDATTGEHLLYPTMPGKRIELLGKRQVEGVNCYDIRVILPNEQQIIYAIDAREFTERQRITTNAVTGDLEVTTHVETEMLEGLAIPVESTMTVDGQFRHAVRIKAITTNSGLTWSVFTRPAELNNRAAGAAWALEDVSAAGASSSAGIGSSAFTLVPQLTGGGSSQSLFPDPNATPVPSILDSIGK